MKKKEVKERKGYEWKDCGNETGYWLKISNKNEVKLSFFCPHCERLTGTIDDKYLREYGVCSCCFVEHIEHRKEPTIDLSLYNNNKK